MSNVVPYLRLTATELKHIACTLTDVLTDWERQWSRVSLQLEVDAVELDVALARGYGVRWGAGHFWVATEAEALHHFLNLALFEQQASAQAHVLVGRVLLRGRDALLGKLLGQTLPQPCAGELPRQRGRSIRVALCIGNAQVTMLLSPALTARILEKDGQQEPDIRWAGYSRALIDQKVHLTAVLGSATIAVCEFVALEPGDVIALDTADQPCLRGMHGPVALTTPCTVDRSQAVFINNFLHS